MAADAGSMLQYREKFDPRLQVAAPRKQSKEPETAFLGVYKLLVEGPDTDFGHPNIVRKLSGHQEKHLKSSSLPELPQQGLAAVSSEGNSTKVMKGEGYFKQNHADPSDREVKEAEMILASRLAEAEENTEVLHSALTATQRELLDLRCRYDKEMNSKAAEIRAMIADLKRADQRAQIAQREVKRLKEQLAGCPTADADSTVQPRRAGLQLEGTLVEKDREIARLQEDAQTLRCILQNAQESSASQIAEMEQQLVDKTEAIERLEAKLRSQSDYDKIKTELSILKARVGSASGSCLQGSPKATEAPDKEAALSSHKHLVEKYHVLQSSGNGLYGGLNTRCKMGRRHMVESQMEGQSVRETGGPVESHTSPLGALHGDEQTSASPGPMATCNPPQQRYSPSTMEKQGKDLISLQGVLRKDDSSLLVFHTSPHLSAKACLSSVSQSMAGGGVKDGEAGPTTNQSESGSTSAGNEECVETSEIAHQVKEQLLKHNIGQRVFGHYVLGLSQGSVSEILARPKPWCKLTVKGKEPFVKMRQFLSDEQNILALRTIQVRQRGSITPRIRTPETGSDDAIKNILEQAKKEIQSQKGSDGTSSDNSSSTSGSSSSDDTIKSILEQARHEMQVQQQQQALQEMEACRWDALKPLLGSVKQEEGVVPGASTGSLTEGPQGPLTVLSPAAFVQNIIRKVKSEIGEAGAYFDQHWSSERDSTETHPFISASPSLSSSSGQQPWSCPEIRDKMSSGKEEVKDESARPVEVKIEAQNVPASKDPQAVGEMSYYATYVPRVLKPTVPPLTPEQYETYMYREVDTIELTKLVKEKLAKNGICQRIFGEKVLGLSQGSVSDMLSRPKPWSKLTQKGREPFIRMQLWLLDQLGQGLSQSSSQSLCLDKNSPPLVSDSSPSPSLSPNEDQPDPTGEPICLALEGSKENQRPDGHTLILEPQNSKPTPSLVSPQLPPYSGMLDIQELVALSPELDTQLVTRRVKEVLMDNNLGQRLFGESVLGLTQGSVSDLLSRPKPWHKLSLKGREPFVRMQLWLNDPHNVAKLRDTKKTEKKAYIKRRYGLLGPGSDSNLPSGCSDSMRPGLPDVSPYGSAKKPRVVLASQEKEALIKAYIQEPYPSQHTVEMLASQLGLKTNTVVNWFHNYRSRMRREVLRDGLQDNDVEVEPPYSVDSLPSPTMTNKEKQEKPKNWACYGHPLPASECIVTVKLEAKEEFSGQERHVKHSKTTCLSGDDHLPQLLKKECEDRPTQGPVTFTDHLSHDSSQKMILCLQEKKGLDKSFSFKTFSEPYHGCLGVSINSPSAASSPGLVTSVSPISSSSAPISPGLFYPRPTANQDLDSSQPTNFKLNRNTSKHDEKVANLNSIIHRLERAANKEDTLEWEF